MRTILDLFSKSPFGALLQHAERVSEAVALVRPLFDAYLAEEWDETEALYERISKLEHKADKAKNEIRSHLPRSLFLPVDRGDVLSYLKQQDAIADAAEDLGVMLTLRHSPLPEALKPRVREFVDASVRASELLMEVAKGLSHVIESSFRRSDVERVLEGVDRINVQEWEADKLQWSLARALLASEAEIDPVTIVLWMHIIEVIGHIANHAENTADRLRLMMALR
ncbi:MAG: TIGR00153 family protein [Gemmatimonadota bacterium]